MRTLIGGRTETRILRGGKWIRLPLNPLPINPLLYLATILSDKEKKKLVTSSIN